MPVKENGRGNGFSPMQLLHVGGITQGELMYRFAVAAVLATIAAPAFAQSTTTTTTTTNEYYVVQDAAKKKCTIVDKKPTTTTMVQVGPMAFKSRTEAESGMKTIKVCETQ
jgi:Tfp pilus assembly protein PilE